MIADGISNTMSAVERRLVQLQTALESGTDVGTPLLASAAHDLSVSLEQLRVALEELETTNEELAASKLVAEQEGRRYKELFQRVPAVCLVTDTKGIILEANEAAEETLGHRLRYLVGEPLSTFVTSTDQSRYFGLLEQIVQGNTELVDDCELSVRVGDDRRFVAGVTVVPVHGLDGERLGARWLLLDLTRQLRQEQERQGAGHRQAYRHISAGVIHHLNNLLGSIRGYSEIISGLPDSGERGLHAAQQIQVGTERGERLTQQLLDFVRVGTRRPEPQSINATVREACDMANELLSDQIRIVTELSPDAGLIRADVLGLYQAVMNLIFNSRDALGDRGEIQVATRRIEVREEGAHELGIRPGPYVAITVSDSGAGMDSETRARATEPFYSTKAIGDGFGLGLSMAEAIVREAKGAVDIQSESGEGTVVALYLPVE